MCYFAHCSNWDEFQSVFTSMNDGQLSPDYKYYNAVLASFAQSGNLNPINKVRNVLAKLTWVYKI